MKETVKSYLTNEWKNTESYTQVKEEIKREITGSGNITAEGQISIMGVEGDSNENTYYGTGAGANLDIDGSGDDAWYNTFLGYGAGINTTVGDSNTFVGSAAGFSNTTGSGNVFIGNNAGLNETGSNKLYIDNSSTSSPLIYGDFSANSLKVNGSFEVTGTLALPGAGTPGAGKVLISDASGNAAWQALPAETGDISSVTAGTGLTGGGTSGDVTLNVDTTSIQGRVSDTCSAGSSIRQINQNGTVICETDDVHGEEGDAQGNTYFGKGAGTNLDVSGEDNAFFGSNAGFSTSSGDWNVFLGIAAGYSNTTGYSNTFLGNSAGYSNTTGSGNVFIGYGAGYNETGSNRLYIDNSTTTTPLIYGDFTDGSEMVQINGTLDTAGNMITVNKADTSAGTGAGTKAPGMSWAGTGRLNIGWGGKGGGNLIAYSKGHATRPGEFFFVFGGGPSIGKVKFAHYDGSKSRIKLSVLANGNVGFGVNEPVYPIEHASGAHLTAGGVWVNASSREYKEGITPLTEREAMEALEGLKPVRYRYKADPGEDYVGFIAEDVPELVATKDRKSLSSMDIVAVLTKVVQKLKAENANLKDRVAKVETENLAIRAELLEKIAQLERQLKLMNTVAER